MSEKVALVTGASSGIGEATSLKLVERGFSVYGVARRVERMQQLGERGVHVMAMDVTDRESMHGVVAQIIAESGRIDVLVNNAGYGSYGAIEDVPIEEARSQFEVNVFGAAELIKQVLPPMRAQRSGRIVNVSSMGGKVYTPLGGWYHATKFALEALSDCLRLEVKPFGIDVVLIEPGAIQTEWGGIAADNLRSVSGADVYGSQANAIADWLRAERGSSPSVIANAIAKAATARRPKTRYAVGYGAKPAIFLHDLLPDRGYDAFIKRASRFPG